MNDTETMEHFDASWGPMKILVGVVLLGFLTLCAFSIRWGARRALAWVTLDKCVESEKLYLAGPAWPVSDYSALKHKKGAVLFAVKKKMFIAAYVAKNKGNLIDQCNMAFREKHANPEGLAYVLGGDVVVGRDEGWPTAAEFCVRYRRYADIPERSVACSPSIPGCWIIYYTDELGLPGGGK